MQPPRGDFRIKLGTRDSGTAAVPSVTLPDANKGFSTETDTARGGLQVGKTDLSSVRPGTWVALLITVLGVPILLFNLFRNAPSGRDPIIIDVDAESAKYEGHMKVSRGSATEIRDELQLIKILEDTGRRKEAELELQKLLLAFRGDHSNPLYQLAEAHLASQAND